MTGWLRPALRWAVVAGGCAVLLASLLAFERASAWT